MSEPQVSEVQQAAPSEGTIVGQCFNKQCKQKREMKSDTISFEPAKNPKTQVAKGKCSVCGGGMAAIISSSKKPQAKEHEKDSQAVQETK